MADNTPEQHSPAGMTAELARQLALASTMTLAISQVQRAREAYADARSRADAVRASSLASAAAIFEQAVSAALDGYHRARAGLEEGAPPDDEEDRF